MQYGQMTQEEREREYLRTKAHYDELCAMGCRSIWRGASPLLSSWT